MYRTSLLLFSACLAVYSAEAAPQPKEPARPTLASVRVAMGKSHLGKEVRAIGRQLGEPPLILYSMWGDERDSGRQDTSFYLSWKAQGADLLFENGDLCAAWFFNGGADEHKRYKGELPDGLTFDDDEGTVVKKIGKPTEVTEFPLRRILGKGPEVEDRWLSYDEKAMSVLFRRPKDGKWAIHYVSLQPGLTTKEK